MTQEKLNEYKAKDLKTAFINPPIPVRFFDWVAWIDGDEEHVGTGKTELEAAENLFENLF